MTGPAGTPYEGGQFTMMVQFPADYPFKPPSVTFTNPKAVYHPNVNEEGLICSIFSKTNTVLLAQCRKFSRRFTPFSRFRPPMLPYDPKLVLNMTTIVRHSMPPLQRHGRMRN